MYNSFEGGFYAIITRKGQKLSPINLGSRFHQEGLQVKGQYILLQDRASIRMWGKPVKIISIKALVLDGVSSSKTKDQE